MTESDPAIDVFLAAVRRSGLVDEARLEAASAAWPDRSQPLPEELVRTLVDGELLTDWQVEQIRKGIRQGKHPPFFLGQGKYRLLRNLGKGGMGAVYLAEDVNLQVKRAIKVLPSKNVDEGSYLERFKREAQATQNLRHQYIVTYTDLNLTGAIKFMAMDYIEGVDLHAKVKRDGPLPIHEAAKYVMQAALGLQYAHDRGVIHRDIKPANLIVDSDGNVKILDFGLALADDKEKDASLTVELNEKVLGTADYLAPEQAFDSHKADARSDIYALGCTLYYLLVGKVLFPEGGIPERLRAHRKEWRPNPLDARSDVPPALSEFYFRMVHVKPEQRPQTAQEVADSLAPWSRAPVPSGAAAAAKPSGSGVGLRPAGSGVGLRPAGSGVGPRPAGSGVGERSPTSGIGRSGGRVITPPSVSGVRRGASKPAGAAGRKQSAKTDTAAAEDTGWARRFRLPRTLGGQPIGLWIAVAVGTSLAIGLAIGVILKWQGARGTKNSPTATRATADGSVVAKPTSKPKAGKGQNKAGESDREPSPLDKAVGAPN